MTLTDEQSAFVDFTLGFIKKKQPQWILVNALAGVGKSSTLCELSHKIENQDDKIKIKYVVFNKSMQQEAEQKGFSENTDISTINSFAFQQVRKFKKLDLTINYDIKLIKSLLKENVSEANIYKATLLLEDFFKSGDLKIDKFYSKIEIPDNTENIDFGSIMKNIFQLMHTDKIKQSHGYYMKLFHKLVIDGHISLKDEYDVIMVDEAQDTSEVFYDALRALDIPIKIAIGDKYQNVYNFIGTVNIFDEQLEPKVEFGFTKSFRLTEEIAWKATEFMQEFLDDKFEIKGLNTNTNDNSILYLSRNNAALIKQMIELMNEGKKFKLLRDYKSIFGTLIALMNSSAGRWKYIDSTKYKWIFNDYNTFTDLNIKDENGNQIGFLTFLFRKYVELGNTDVTSAIKLIWDIGPYELFEVYKHVKDSLYYKSNITLSTIHTAKGSEAGTIILLEDIKKMKDEFIKDKKKLEKEAFLAKHKHELYLYYVAQTRAKHTIIGD